MSYILQKESITFLKCEKSWLSAKNKGRNKNR